MVPSEFANSAVSQALVRAGWLPLADRLVAGICHDLNGRASALSGLVHLLDLDTELDRGGLLSDEVEKLETVSGQLSLLVGDPDGPAEPLVAGDLVTSLIALQGRERGTDGVQVSLSLDADAPPILVNWTTFSRVFLLLLSTASQGPVAGDRRVDVALATDDHGGLRLTVSAPAIAPAGERAAALQNALYPSAALVEWDGVEFSVRFPSLAQSRQAQDGS